MTTTKLLVIDDDNDFAEGLSLALELDGNQVDTVPSGEDGIAAAKDTAFDAIMIDIGLPGLNGVETLRQIKQVSPETRCFLLTGYSAEDLLQQGIDAGAAEILTKPIDVEELLQLLAAGQARDH